MLSTGFENQFVHISMERLVGKRCELPDALPIVVLLLRPFTQASPFRVYVSEDARATRVQPITGRLFAVALQQPSFNRFGGVFVIRSIGSICDMSVWPAKCKYIFHPRSTISALAHSALNISSSSNPPKTMRTDGYAFWTMSALSFERTRAAYSYSGWAFERTYSASPAMYPVTPVLASLAIDTRCECGSRTGRSWEPCRRYLSKQLLQQYRLTTNRARRL